MIIAFSTLGPTLNDHLDERFGRSQGFLLYDTETQNIEYIPNNQSKQAIQGAGIQSAQLIIDKKAKILITGNIGPKAFNVLTKQGIEILKSENAIIADIIENWNNNKLSLISKANTIGLQL